jgi:hypothetical protein
MVTESGRHVQQVQHARQRAENDDWPIDGQRKRARTVGRMKQMLFILHIQVLREAQPTNILDVVCCSMMKLQVIGMTAYTP